MGKGITFSHLVDNFIGGLDEADKSPLQPGEDLQFVEFRVYMHIYNTIAKYVSTEHQQGHAEDNGLPPLRRIHLPCPISDILNFTAA